MSTDLLEICASTFQGGKERKKGRSTSDPPGKLCHCADEFPLTGVTFVGLPQAVDGCEPGPTPG